MLPNDVLAVLLFAAAIVLTGIALRPRRAEPTRKPHWRPAKSSVVWTRPGKFSERCRDAASADTISTPDITDTAFQLNAVMKAAFQRRRVMNGSEYNVFKIVESEIKAASNGYRVFAQLSLGEVLQSKDSGAFRCVNSKRVDVLVIDHKGYPAFAVEYQGSGHYQGDAAARDAVKKEALRKAGVGYIEVNPADGEEQLRLRIREQLGLRAPEPPHRNDGPKIHPIKLVPQLH